MARRRAMGLSVALSLAFASGASGASFSPGRFVVSGRGLFGHGLGRSVSVFARPTAVTVDGCVSHRAHVRVGRRSVSLSAAVACAGVKGRRRLAAVIRGKVMTGQVTVGRRVRSFHARLQVPRGKLLAGRPRAPAIGAVRNGDAVTRHPAGEVSASHGVKVLRTELLTDFSPHATVGQVNAVLALLGGRIVGSFARSPLITVAIPDPGSLAAVDALRRLLERQPGVVRAERSTIPQPDDLPNGFSVPLTDTPGALALHQLLALRMPAAWNAQKALDLGRRPLFLLEDFFGNGLPDSHLDVQFINPSAFLTGAPDASAHGYHVLGIAAGNHDSDGSSAGLVTGVFPARTDLDVVDLTGTLTDSDMLNLLRDEVLLRSRTDPHIVISTSLHGTEGFVVIRELGLQWLDFIRDNGLEDHVLQATSAGNESITDPHSRLLVNALDNSPWTVAALATKIHGQPVVGLQNTLVVESVSDSGLPSFDPGCRSGYSDVGGNISAYGDDVYSDLLGSNAGTLSGTSMATPEIAALGEYLWTMAPDLTASQIRRAIELNFSQQLMACQDQPAADAYAAALSLDQPGDPSQARSPVRFAILDQNHDGRFDEADVSAFADHIFADPPTADRDWSPYDLNGDGFTGGDTKAPFDLDTNGSTRAGAPQLGTVTQTAHDTTGNPVQLQFDEPHVTDADVLCYYAYSPLYTVAASDDQRDKILGNHCQPPVKITSCGSTTDLEADASVPSDATGGEHKTGGFSVNSPGCSPPVGESAGPVNASDSGVCVGAQSCRSTGSAQGAADASGSIAPGGASMSVSYTGEASATDTVAGSGHGDSDGDASVVFVLGTTCNYTITGSVSHSQSPLDSSATDSVSLSGGGTTVFVLQDSGGGQSGTLPPGTYRLNTGGVADSSANEQVGSTDATIDGSASLSLTC